MREYKVVSKPWGEEHWLELNDRYCFKRIVIKAGCRTSLHYHNRKQETNVVISGYGSMWLVGADGGVVPTSLSPGDSITLRPCQPHRVEATTDMVLMEVSTPEVDDVIRLQDDTSRGDGRITLEHDRCLLPPGSG